MTKEELYHIALDDYEHGIVIRSLNDEKTDLMNQGKSTDAVDDLIIKIGTAPKKKFKVISKDRSDAERYGHLFDDVQKSIANDLNMIRRGGV